MRAIAEGQTRGRAGRSSTMVVAIDGRLAGILAGADPIKTTPPKPSASSTVYNALGIPVAAGVVYPFFGLLLSPRIAGAAMRLSSVSVISNAVRLRSTKL